MTALAGKTVLVTGAGGFVGSAVARHLLEDGAQVRGLVRSAKKGEWLAEIGAQPVIGDITDLLSLRSAASGCEIVLHVAAALDGSWAKQYAANVNGTGNVVEAAAEAGARRIVHVSSIAAYGYNTPDLITEETPLRPGADYYGQTKALAEARFWERVKSFDLEGVVVRPGMIYGPGSRFWTRVMFKIVRRLPAPMFGDGSACCPLIYIDDVADLLCVAAEHPRAAGETFNAVMDPSPTWHDYLDAYAAMAGRERYPSLPAWALRLMAAAAEPLTVLLNQPQPVRGFADLLLEKRHYSMAKAAALLDWRPLILLEEGMANAEAWLREIGELKDKKTAHG